MRERIGCRTAVFLLSAVKIQGGGRCSLAGNAEQPGDLLRKFDAGLYTHLDHAEEQHRHKSEGKRDQPAAPEEIVEVQAIKKAADSIAEFAAAKGSTLLLGGECCIGRRQLKLFHKGKHSFLEQ